MGLLNRLWNDEAGFIVSAELILIATVLVIGMLVGLATVRDNIVQELADVADAFSEIVQSYSFSAITGHSSSTGGSVFADLSDFCEDLTAGGSDQTAAGLGVQCLNMNVALAAGQGE